LCGGGSQRHQQRGQQNSIAHHLSPLNSRMDGVLTAPP